jgi:hypothetical protein
MPINENSKLQYEPYIVLVLEIDTLKKTGWDPLDEGQWQPSHVKDLWARVDPANPSTRS